MAKYFLMPRAIAELTLLSVLLLAGCQKQPQRVLIAPPPPAPAARPAPPAELPPPPKVDTPEQPTATLPADATTEVPPAPSTPEAPKAKRRSRSKKENSATPPAATEAPAPLVAPAQDPPQLGEVLSQQDMRRMNADLDRAIRNAQAILRSLTGKILTAQQQSAATQIMSFLRQAVEVRSQDLASARSLAQRAEVIARDLANSVR